MRCKVVPLPGAFYVGEHFTAEDRHRRSSGRFLLVVFSRRRAPGIGLSGLFENFDARPRSTPRPGTVQARPGRWRPSGPAQRNIFFCRLICSTSCLTSCSLNSGQTRIPLPACIAAISCIPMTPSRKSGSEIRTLLTESKASTLPRSALPDSSSGSTERRALQLPRLFQ